MADVQHFSGTVTPVASTTSKCGLVVTPGAEPTTPEPGGIWYDTGDDCLVYFAPDGTKTYLPKGTGLAGQVLISGGVDTAPTYGFPGSMAENYSSAGSHQTVAADLTLAAGAGKDVADGTAFLGPIMGNLWNAAPLTKTGDYLGGVIAHYSVTGSGATHYPKGAILAGIGDGSVDADGAVVAYIDGDSAQTNAGAAFKVRCNNSIGASGFNYGLDLQDAAHDGYAAVAYKNAPVRIGEDLVFMHSNGVPVAEGTGFAGKGSICIDYTNGNIYLNTGTKGVPIWTISGAKGDKGDTGTGYLACETKRNQAVAPGGAVTSDLVTFTALTAALLNTLNRHLTIEVNGYFITAGGETPTLNFFLSPLRIAAGGMVTGNLTAGVKGSFRYRVDVATAIVGANGQTTYTTKLDIELTGPGTVTQYIGVSDILSDVTNLTEAITPIVKIATSGACAQICGVDCKLIVS